MNNVGVAAHVLKITRVKKRGRQSFSVLIEGLCRFKLKSIAATEPYLTGDVEQLELEDPSGVPEPSPDSKLGEATAEFKVPLPLCAPARSVRHHQSLTTSHPPGNGQAAAERLVEQLKQRLPVVSRLETLLNETPLYLLCDLFVMAIDATFSERLAVS